MVNYSTRYLSKRFLLLFILLWTVATATVTVQSFAQVRIPRAGFPYCQPFTGSTVNPNTLPFTIAKGNTILNFNPLILGPDENLVLTGNALQLTPTATNKRGYVLIDLPFSSEYGIKASFEYFMHTPGGSGLGDGLSFFLIDGSVTAATFQIGGVGGSLGYAPHGSNSAGSYSSGGVTGGYMGIGFDVLGNFGNFQEKKYGGFHNPNQFNFNTPNPDIKLYPNSIVVRGPLNAGDPTRRNGSPATNATNLALDSYQFIDGLITDFDPTPGAYGGLQPRVNNGSGDLLVTNPSEFLGTSQMFKIGSGLRPQDLNCALPLPTGYRKVFIDLEPTGNPLSPYRIKVDMLIGSNPTPVNIFNNLIYSNKPAPATLKVGFAASTGSGYYSTQEIRNVAVQVSSIEDSAKPLPPPLFREICIDEPLEVDFPFCVELPSSNSAFIQCIQLSSTNPGPGDNDFANDAYECGLSGYCAQRCNETFKRLDAIVGGVKVGEFIAELDDEVEVGQFNRATIRFVRTNPSFFGTVTAWYKIVDNFGLESDGTPITITINPLPELVSPGTKVDVTCDGQGDGEINGIVIRNLVPDPDKYQVLFLDDANNPITPVLVSEVVQPNGYITATFDLKNINLGTYRVRAINPSSESLGNVCSDGFDDITADDCEAEFTLHTLDLERGIPVELDPYVDEICEGEVFEVTPSLDPKFNPNNLPVPYKWYTDENRTQPLNNGTTAIIDGANVTVAIASNGELSLTGLEADGFNPKTYTFYVETLFRDNSASGAGNFCPYDGDVTTVATVTVFPELQTSTTITPDWCRATAGQIQVNAQGGNGQKTYNLYLSGNPTPIATQVTNLTTHTFSGLLPGTYEVEIFTQNPTCSKLIGPLVVDGPTTPLTLTTGTTVNAFCASPNGSLQFTLTGGNPGYTITLNGSPLTGATIVGNSYTVSNLAAGTYTISVTDSRSCVQSSSMTIQGDPVSQFAATSDEICQGETAQVSPQIINQSTSTPVFRWYYRDGTGAYVQISSGSTVNGATFAIDASFNLSVSGLTPQATPYTYYLEVTGSKVCPQGYIPAQILVNPSPVLAPALLTQVTCAGNANGSIRAQLGSGNLSDFEFNLTGNNGFSSGFLKNSGQFNNLAPGTYSLTVRSAKGCESQQTGLNITEPTPLVVNNVLKTDAFCGQNNGTLSFSITGGTPLSTGGYTILLNGTPAAGVTGAGSTFTISNLPPNSYTLSVIDGNGCTQSSNVTIAAEPASQFGTISDEICEGETAQVSPQVINQSTSTPSFKWFYQDGGGAYVAIASGSTVNGATFTIDGSSNLSVAGLTPQATPYTFFLEVTGTKVCPQGYLPAQILVNPKPVLTPALITQVTCTGSANGSIRAQLATGNLSDFEFNLTGNNGFSSGFLKNSGVFNALAPGTYSLTVRSAKGCESVQPGLIITEPTPLVLSQVTKTDATCDQDNGSLRFSVSGGTPLSAGGYTLVVNGAPLSSLSGVTTNSPTDFTLTGLAPGLYLIQATDLNGCVTSLSSTLADTPVPQFDATGDQICEGEVAIVTPSVVSNTIGASPIYTWSFPDPANPATLIPISDGDVVGGVTYDLTDGVLSISGLAPNSNPYNYFLTVSGDKVCPANPIEVQVEVRKIPVAVFEETPVSCFGANNGQIRLISVDPTGPSTFTLLPTGSSNTTGNFAGLVAGSYTIRVQENGSPCFQEFPVEVTQPDQLALTNLTEQDPTCGEINGNVRFVVTGGVKAYQLTINSKPLSDFTFSLSGDTYEVRNLAPGTYSVEIRDANACQLNLPNLFTLVNDDGFSVDLATMEDEVCVGQQAQLVPLFNSALPVSPVLRWYRDAGLTQPISSSASPAPDGVTYQVNPANGTLSLTGLAAGTYTYYLEVSGAGICTVVQSGEVTVLPPITATVTIGNITCLGDSDGSLTLLPSGGNGFYEVSLNGSPFTSNLSYTNLPAGNYQISIRNSLSCTFTQTVTVAGPSAAIGINTPTLERSSCDLNNGAIRDLKISGGWGGYTVTWRRGSVTGPIVSGTLTEALNLAPGTYFLQIQDQEGCQATFDFEIEESSDPVYAVVPPINSCTGTPVQIRPVHIAPNPGLPPAAATEVRWYAGPSQTGLIQSGPDPTNPAVIYTIDDTDWLNPQLQIQGLPAGVYDFYFYVVCTGQEIKVDVSVFDTPAVSLETDPVTCFGDSNGKIRLLSGALPPYTYQLNGGPILSQSALEALSLPAGNYTLVVATPAGCAQTVNFIIEGPSGPLAVSPLSKVDPGCGAPNGKLVFSVSGGYLPYTLDVIKDGVSQGTQTLNQANFQLDGYRPGVYQIRIRDKEGCEVLTNTVVLVDGPTQILVEDEAICEGEVARLLPELDPLAPGATFQWYFDAAKTQPILSSATPAADGRIYQINPTTGELSISNLPTSGSGFTFFVTASGAGVCPGFTGTGRVIVAGLPVASVQVTNEVCFGTGGRINVSASGGSGSYSYSLNGGAFGSSTVFQVPTGTHSIAVRTSDGCITTVTGIQVLGPSAALGTSAFQQNNPTCDLSNGSISFNVSGGYAPYTISYTLDGSPIGSTSLGSAGPLTISGLREGTYRFTLLDGQGCTLDVSAPIILVEEPTSLVTQDQVICAGETAQLVPNLPPNISNPVYTWSFDAAGNNPVPSGTSGGVTFTQNPNGSLTIDGLAASVTPYTYYIMASGVGICGLSPKPVRVTVNEIPSLRVSNPSVVCNPQGTVDLTDFIEGYNPSVYDYTILSPSGAAMQIGDLENVAVSGDYRVSSSIKGKGCWNQPQRIRVIIADEELVADFQYEVDLGNGSTLTNAEVQIQEDVLFEDLSLGKAIIWNWDFGDGTQSTQQNPTHQYQKKGTYTVNLQAIDEFGCVSEFQRVIQVFDDYVVMVPNAFTPEGTKNRLFRPFYRGIASMDFYIFNKWGELIYHATSLEDQGWDGTHLGKPAPNGNYVYRGVFTSRSGEKVEKAGTFVLIR